MSPVQTPHPTVLRSDFRNAPKVKESDSFRPSSMGGGVRLFLRPSVSPHEQTGFQCSEFHEIFYWGGYNEFCQENSCLKWVKDEVQFSCNLHKFMTIATVIVQVTSDPMVATATDVTMVIIAIKITNLPSRPLFLRVMILI